MGTTTITKPETTAGGNGAGHGPGGFDGNFGGGWEARPWQVPSRTYRLGMWFALAGVVMLFAAFTSAMVVRRGMSFDWVPIQVPRLLWLNTLVLLASSGTFELSRRSLQARDGRAFSRWLNLTLLLGVAFLAGQLAAWRELAARGVYLSTNPSSSFFYLLTAAHGVHLLGGVAALCYVALRAGRIASREARRTAFDVTALYWHFMDALWIYIFFLLTRWL